MDKCKYVHIATCINRPTGEQLLRYLFISQQILDIFQYVHRVVLLNGPLAETGWQDTLTMDNLCS